jgi:transmembrane sensor
MNPSDRDNPRHPPTGLEDRVAEDFLKRRSAGWSEADERRHREALRDPDFAAAHRKMDQLWQGVDQNANRPEFLGLREQALARARRANRRRFTLPWTALQKSWTLAAGLMGIAILGATLWQLSPYGFRPGVYQTGIGEQRMVELSDHSHIALDSGTKLRAIMTADSRIIEITQGQAEFSVAHDPARPFKVIAGGHTIVAVGTVFTVEYADDAVRVAMMEGKVAVLTTGGPPELQPQDAGMNSAPARADSATGPASGAIQLSAGEELRFARNGKATLTREADLAAATAWREGKVIFHAEPLGEAVRRLNRYSHVQLQVDDSELSNLSVSGVFDAGDSRAFAEAVEAYLPVVADYSQSNLIKLRMNTEKAMQRR